MSIETPKETGNWISNMMGWHNAAPWMKREFRWKGEFHRLSAQTRATMKGRRAWKRAIGKLRRREAKREIRGVAQLG